MSVQLKTRACGMLLAGISGVFFIIGGLNLRPQLDSVGLLLIGLLAIFFSLGAFVDADHIDSSGVPENIHRMYAVMTILFGMFAALVVFAPESINVMVHGHH